MEEDEFIEELAEILTYEQAYHFFLVSRGVKPGIMLIDISRTQKKQVEKNCPDDYELYADESEIFKPTLKRRIKSWLGLSREGLYSVYISPETGRIEELKKGLKSEENDARVTAKFLGYPDAAAEYFEKADSSPAKQTEKKIQEMRESGELSEEEAEMLDYVDYVPLDSKECIQNAVERGEKFLETLETEDSKIAQIILKEISES